MSGGSYDYSFHHVDDMGLRLERSDDPRRREFAAHLRLVATAMHDIEWVDSGDTAEGSEHGAIDAVLNNRNPKETQ